VTSCASDKDKAMSDAVDHCANHHNITYADGAINISQADENSIDDLACVLDRLDTPTDVRDEMSQSSFLTGRQHASTGGYKYSWSMGPTGMNMVISH